MNQRLSFSKPRGYALCSSLEKRREHCWTLCPTWPRFYKREKKEKMVEVRRGGQGREREAGIVGGREEGVVWERRGDVERGKLCVREGGEEVLLYAWGDIVTLCGCESVLGGTVLLESVLYVHIQCTCMCAVLASSEYAIARLVIP